MHCLDFHLRKSCAEGGEEGVETERGKRFESECRVGQAEAVHSECVVVLAQGTHISRYDRQIYEGPIKGCDAHIKGLLRQARAELRQHSVNGRREFVGHLLAHQDPQI